MKIIIISGKAQHGKDTFANFAKDILESKNKKVLIAHFGDLVKYTAKTFFNWDGKKDENGRSILQSVGTNDIRTKYPDFWVNYIRDVLSVYYNEWDYVLIPDCRFFNEITKISSLKIWEVITIRVNRPNFDNGLTEEQKNHPSETNLDNYDFDYYIKNDGSLEEYKNKVNIFIEFIENFL